MTIKTKVFWGESSTLVHIQPKEAQFIAGGATDGTTEVVDNAVVRTWATQEAAQEWINFLNSKTPAPTSAVIIEE